MRTTSVAAPWFFLALALAGCGGTRGLHASMARELGCPAEEVDFRRLPRESRTAVAFQAQGCRQDRTFDCTRDGCRARDRPIFSSRRLDRSEAVSLVGVVALGRRLLPAVALLPPCEREVHLLLFRIDPEQYWLRIDGEERGACAGADVVVHRTDGPPIRSGGLGPQRALFPVSPRTLGELAHESEPASLEVCGATVTLTDEDREHLRHLRTRPVRRWGRPSP
jgi:hypothetical protein